MRKKFFRQLFLLPADNMVVAINPSPLFLPNNGILQASALPVPLSLQGAIWAIANASLNGSDISAGEAGFWVIDRNARFEARPQTGHACLMQARRDGWGIYSIDYNIFTAGHDPELDHITLPHNTAMQTRLRIATFPGLFFLNNLSVSDLVFIGGACLKPGHHVRLRSDAFALIGFTEPISPLDGSFIIGPETTLLKSALEAMKISGGRSPWHAMPLEKRSYSNKKATKTLPHQAIHESEDLVTPSQVRELDILKSATPDDLDQDGVLVRTSLRNWIDEGRLEDHARGKHSWDKRLLANIQNGGMLLPTHSTDLSGASAILASGVFDPKFSRKGKVFLRYGLGHSYGQIVFVQMPQIAKVEDFDDFWHVMQPGKNAREELLRLISHVDYNRNLPLKAINPLLREDRVIGRTAMACHQIDDSTLMELFPQFGSKEPVSIDHTYAVLVPEHLYDELLSKTPEHLRDLLICIPGTGRTEREFLEGRNNVARRTRYKGGTFEPTIGYSALFRYELTYFKLVEIALRHQHCILRRRIENLAEASWRNELDHADILRTIESIVPLLPEAFRLLHYQDQYKSHDGHSPMVHTFNAIIEACHLAPALAKEFPQLHYQDVFLAILFHDLGKIKGARSDDHGKHSLEMARYHLKMMGMNPHGEGEDNDRARRILHLIKESGLISEVSIAMERGESFELAAGRRLPRAGELLPEVFMLNFSDTASIPGRSGRKMLVYRDYHPIDVRRRLIEIFRRSLNFVR